MSVNPRVGCDGGGICMCDQRLLREDRPMGRPPSATRGRAHRERGLTTVPSTDALSSHEQYHSGVLHSVKVAYRLPLGSMGNLA